MKVRKHIYFSGQVQGVGFLYRSYYIAQYHGLTGWVQNLWDDRGEMEVQGEAEVIEAFLNQLSSQRLINIEHMETSEIPLNPEDREFTIKD